MLTLILGPSGSGKSVRLREELRQRARSRQRSILIVPEQFTSSTEGALYHALGDELSAYVESYSLPRWPKPCCAAMAVRRCPR